MFQFENHIPKPPFAATVETARNAQAAALRALLASDRIRLAARRSVMPVLLVIAVLLYSHALMLEGVSQANDVVLVTIFAAAAISSIAGFAFSAVCGAVLFHLPIGQVAVVQFMMVCSIAIQFYMVAALWRSIPWPTVARFLTAVWPGCRSAC